MKKLTAFLLFLATILAVHGAELKTLAHWDFSSNDPQNCGSHPLRLRGTAKIENGMLFSSEENASKSCGAEMIKTDKSVTPKNAFSLSIDFIVNQDAKRQSNTSAILWDNKYVYNPSEKQANMHKGFALWIRMEKDDKCSFGAAFGLGDKSATATSKSVKCKVDEKHNIKLTFNATGKVTFTLDGTPIGGADIPSGSIVPPAYPVTLADRRGSNYTSLGGGIYNVTLKEEEYRPLVITPDIYFRKVFERGENDIAIHGEFSNFTSQALQNITIKAETAGKSLPDQTLADVAANSTVKLSWPLSQWLLPDNYTLNVKAVDADGKELTSTKLPFAIVPEYGDFMPVLLWGKGKMEEVKAAGFTHRVANIYPIRGDFTEKSVPDTIRNLDDELQNGLYVYSAVYPKYRFLTSQRFLCKDRSGKPYAREGLEASRPEVQEEYGRVAEQVSKYVGDHPAWDSTLINSEIRGSAHPSFTGIQEANFKKFAGYDIPADITGATPHAYTGIKGFPWDRIIDAKDPHYVYYTWFRRNGDGWNDTQTVISENIHKHMKHHHFTFHDPAVRVLPMWGSGGKVDVISQWTYTYPDAIKISQATDELLAMADGAPGQSVMKMTQAIWYRDPTAPLSKKVDNPPEWLKEEEKAKFITIAPDFLREAIWCKISHKIDGIMYHGSGSLLGKEEHSYRYTNSESKKVLADTVNRVIKPLGPTLKKIPELAPEIAILESATGWLYNSGHMTGGWSNGWAADLHQALQWANIQPSIIYEDHLLTNTKLDNIKVIFMPGAEVLTQPVKDKLVELQNKGVILIGDEFTAPGLMVDFRLKSIKRNSSDPKGSKAAFQKLGKDIADMLKPYYDSPIAASNQDLVVRRRGNNSADYVFVINDKRTFGDYVGQWGLVMEKGLPNSGTITVKHNTVAAYDLVAHKKIKFSSKKNVTTFNVDIAPADGALVLLLAQEINSVKLDTPKADIAKEAAYSIKVKVADKKGQAIKAIIPVEVTLIDAAGTRLPGSGFYSAVDGELTINETAAPNMASGKVTVLAKDLASGLTAKQTFSVK